MRSLFRGTNHAASRKRSSATRPSQTSLGLRGLLPEAEDQTLRVLDLGPARPANLDFFSRYGGHLTVADFYSGLRAARAATTNEDDERKVKAFAELLPFDKDTRFDLVLAWDLLNYLTPQEHHLLMTCLRAVLSRGHGDPRVRFDTKRDSAGAFGVLESKTPARSSTKSAKAARGRVRAISKGTC